MTVGNVRRCVRMNKSNGAAKQCPANNNNSTNRFVQEPLRLRRRARGTGFFSCSSSSSRNECVGVRRGAGGAGAATSGGIAATDSGVTCHGIPSDECCGGGGGGGTGAGGSLGAKAGATGRLVAPRLRWDGG